MRRRALVLIILILLIYLSSSFITSLFIPVHFSQERRRYVYSSKIAFVNYGDKVQNLESDLLAFNIFMNLSWQTAYLETVSGKYRLTEDFDGNQMLVFNSSSLPPGENVTLSYSMMLEERIRLPPDVAFASAGNLSDVPEELRGEFCGAEGSWLLDEGLRSLANEVWRSQGMTTNVLRIASALADWVGSHVRSVSHDFPYYPNETYRSLEGDCDDQANLLIALCRFLGVPAYLQVGSLRWSSESETYLGGHVTSNLKDVAYHAWAVLYVPPWGWLPFDMTLGWRADDALAVVSSAKVWGLDAMTIMNVTRSDWPGGGRAQNKKIMASSIYIYYEDALVIQKEEGSPPLPAEWLFLGVVAVVITLSSVAWRTLRRNRGLNKERFSNSKGKEERRLKQYPLTYGEDSSQYGIMEGI